MYLCLEALKVFSLSLLKTAGSGSCPERLEEVKDLIGAGGASAVATARTVLAGIVAVETDIGVVS